MSQSILRTRQHCLRAAVGLLIASGMLYAAPGLVGQTGLSTSCAANCRNGSCYTKEGDCWCGCEFLTGTPVCKCKKAAMVTDPA